MQLDSERRWQARRALVVVAGVVILIGALALVYALTGSDDTFDPVRSQRVVADCEASTDRDLNTAGIELDGMTPAQRDHWTKENNACLRQHLGNIPLTTEGDASDGP
jgi:hypothetical protein